jgi:hypothetical protein
MLPAQHLKRACAALFERLASVGKKNLFTIVSDSAETNAT